MHQLDETCLVGERRRQGISAPGFENEARFGAVDSDLLDIGIREVLGKRAEGRDRGKDPTPQALRLFSRHGR
jgi:hypothetical protein